VESTPDIFEMDISRYIRRAFKAQITSHLWNLNSNSRTRLGASAKAISSCRKMHIGFTERTISLQSSSSWPSSESLREAEIVQAGRQSPDSEQHISPARPGIVLRLRSLEKSLYSFSNIEVGDCSIGISLIFLRNTRALIDYADDSSPGINAKPREPCEDQQACRFGRAVRASSRIALRSRAYSGSDVIGAPMSIRSHIGSGTISSPTPKRSPSDARLGRYELTWDVRGRPA